MLRVQGKFAAQTNSQKTEGGLQLLPFLKNTLYWL